MPINKSHPVHRNYTVKLSKILSHFFYLYNKSGQLGRKMSCKCKPERIVFLILYQNRHFPKSLFHVNSAFNDSFFHQTTLSRHTSFSDFDTFLNKIQYKYKLSPTFRITLVVWWCYSMQLRCIKKYKLFTKRHNLQWENLYYGTKCQYLLTTAETWLSHSVKILSSSCNK
jgi:hypothetical protein